MAKTMLGSVASPDVLQNMTRVAPIDPSIDMGKAGGQDSLKRLNDAVKELKAVASAPFLQRAMSAMKREDHVAAAKWALKGLEIDEHSGPGWYLLGIARERAGDFQNSVLAYEAALNFFPEHAEIANDLGRLAFRMGMPEQAEALFLRFIEYAPDRLDGFNNLASVYREQGRPEAAIEMIRSVLMQHPDTPMLWNTLASTMMDVNDYGNAVIFFEEALRLDPKFGKARYNLGQAKHYMGDSQGALDDCNIAMKQVITAEDRQMMLLARSSYNLCLGNIGVGWDEYEARLSPQFAGVTHFYIDRPKWKPGADLSGKNLLVVGEQGLGDEVLFANVLPDVLEKLGPDGKLQLVVEKRLIPLFQASFPTAQVTSHVTKSYIGQPLRIMAEADHKAADMWTPMGCLLREFRRSLDAYPKHEGYLKPDPARVAHWRKVLEDAPPGPKVGLLWKSAVTKGRLRFFSPFEQWASVMKTPGVSFVNLQYGDCAEDLARARQEFGVEIWNPPGIDLKDDLADVAALCCAVDLTVGFSNATLNLAGGAGAPIWLISAPGAWPRLGTKRYPWYPQARVFVPESFGDWQPVMDEVADALADWAKVRA